MSADQLIREYHGCEVRSTPVEDGLQRDGERITCDGYFHAVYRGKNLVGECHTLAEAIQVAKGKQEPKIVDSPLEE
jgi:hypothetical protein